ncbi:MAG: hypothetical protein AAF908_01470 [Pseudomonadota bacterium]
MGLIISAILGAGGAGAAPILVDDFTAAQDVGLLGVPGFIPSSSQVGFDATILGGFRDMEVSGNASSFIEVRSLVQAGRLTHS